MLLVELSKHMMTGIPAMDAEHQFLVDSLNKVYDILREDKSKAYHFFDTVIVTYVDKHLNHEEAIMEKYQFPEIETHKKAHDVYRKVILDLVPSIESGNPKSFMEAYSISMGWLTGHIEKVDGKYAKWFLDNNLIDELINENPEITEF